MNIADVYYPVKGEEKRFLKCSLVYEKGGIGPLTGQDCERGYYVQARPVKRDGLLESFVLFDGTKRLLLACSRQGRKLEDRAKALFDERHLEVARQFVDGRSDLKVDFDHPDTGRDGE